MKNRELKRRKKIPSQLISFDEDLKEESSGGKNKSSRSSPLWVQSAPTTCLNSPALGDATPYADTLCLLSEDKNTTELLHQDILAIIDKRKESISRSSHERTSHERRLKSYASSFSDSSSQSLISSSSNSSPSNYLELPPSIRNSPNTSEITNCDPSTTSNDILKKSVENSSNIFHTDNNNPHSSSQIGSTLVEDKIESPVAPRAESSYAEVLEELLKAHSGATEGNYCATSADNLFQKSLKNSPSTNKKSNEISTGVTHTQEISDKSVNKDLLYERAGHSPTAKNSLTKSSSESIIKTSKASSSTSSNEVDLEYDVTSHKSSLSNLSVASEISR